jgi:predicted RNA-binding Zn-ribbon protein involved in translation (DUF1610 family)
MKTETKEYCPKCGKEQPTKAEGYSDLGNSYLVISCAVCGTTIRTVRPGEREKK